MDYNITTIEEILLARAWAEKQEAVEEQTLISRTLESWVGDEMHACGTNQQSLWMIFDTKFPDFEGWRVLVEWDYHKNERKGHDLGKQ